MYRRFHDRFGTAGVIIGVIALVVALAGTAFAAAGLNSKQKKEVTKIAKKYAGKNGENGAPGANGTNGAPGERGPQGEKGADGSNGVSAEAASFSGNLHGCVEGGVEVKSAKPTVYVCNGEAGANGTNGTSAEATSFSGNLHGCVEGGVEVKSAKPTVYVCNGSPWVAGGTLPSGKTETGAWEFPAAASGPQFEAVAFPIPLASEISETKYIPVGGRETKAEGTGDLTNESFTVKNVSTSSGEFKAGYYVEGTGIPAGALITQVISPTEFKISKEATATSTGVSLTAKGAQAECENASHPGVANAENPEAGKGFMCVYAAVGALEFNFLLVRKPTNDAEPGASTAGAILEAPLGVTGGSIKPYASGTWAVTAP